MKRNLRIALAMVLIAVAAGIAKAQSLHRTVIHDHTHLTHGLGEFDAVSHVGIRKQIVAIEHGRIAEHFHGSQHQLHDHALTPEGANRAAVHTGVAGHAQAHMGLLVASKAEASLSVIASNRNRQELQYISASD